MFRKSGGGRKISREILELRIAHTYTYEIAITPRTIPTLTSTIASTSSNRKNQSCMSADMSSRLTSPEPFYGIDFPERSLLSMSKLAAG
jgi:hypothetical protein